jgi:hypothetical protein
VNKFIFSVRTLVVAFLLCTFCPSEAATNNAASAAFIDVSNAVAVASPGDTVIIPPGTNEWNSTLTINGISLLGSGTNATVLQDNEPGDIALIVLSPTTTNLTRLSNLSIANGKNSVNGCHGKIIASAATSPEQWCIDNVLFNELNGDNIFVYGHAISVIDHCTFILNGSAITLRDSGLGTGDSGYGDWSWANPPAYGTSNELYIEDCVFTNIIPGSSSSAAFDCLAGGRSVFRNNIVLNTFWANHGTETGNRYRGCRSFEIYNNIFIDSQGFYTAINFRSGSGVVFSNTSSGYGSMVTINNYRSTDAFTPFGGVTGFNPWDNNSPNVYLTGIHLGTNNSPVLVVTNAGWTTNQWSGYTVNDTNTGRFCLIVGNTSDTMTMESPEKLSPITFNNGDGFQLYYCYPALDQVGVGSGDLLVGDGAPYGPLYNSVTTTNSWPHQVSEPLYAWGNTLNGAPANIGSGYPNIQENRDFFNNTAKPSYTPFTYPHPLAAAQNSDTFAFTNGVPTNSILSPPSDMHAGPP